MRRIVIMLLSLMLVAGMSYAATDLTEEDYRDLDKFHSKLVRIKREMDRLMKDVISTYPDEARGIVSGSAQDIKIDISEDENNLIVRADMPGMEKDKIDIVLEHNRFLKISGIREEAKSQTAPGMVKQERRFGKVERVLELPVEASAEGIKASYKNGVLEIVIPKKKGIVDKKVKVVVM